jgi:hypothetical protein
MSNRFQISASPDADSVRAYILGMVTQLADMADKIQDSVLAHDLRFVAQPDEQSERLLRKG